MAKPVSISVNKFTTSVQSAVTAAMEKHHKFKSAVPSGITVAYLIRGFPVPDDIVGRVTLGEAQAFATDVAAHLASAVPQLAAAAVHPGGGGQGTVLSVGRHVLIGIPAQTDFVHFEP
jgi:hypothetical protein